MIIASHDFRDEEYAEPRAAFEEEGWQVTVASSSVNVSKGMLGLEVKPDILIKDVKVDDYDLVVYVGGYGSQEYFQDATAHKIAQKTLEKNKVLGAICVAPSILANAGLLKGVQATCFSSERGNLEAKGAQVSANPVEKSGNIITAEGPKAAKAFGKTLVDTLKKS